MDAVGGANSNVRTTQQLEPLLTSGALCSMSDAALSTGDVSSEVVSEVVSPCSTCSVNWLCSLLTLSTYEL